LLEEFAPRNPIFIETGTHMGNGVLEAQKYPFKKIASIEIIQGQVLKLKNLFKTDIRVEIICDNSHHGLKNLLPQITDNAVFWLDAHFPGADLNVASYTSEKDNDIRLPLEKELTLIKNLRKEFKDLILFDDLFLYKDNGAHVMKVWGNRPEIMPKQRFSANEFYKDIFKETHDFEELDQHEGYGILRPK
jgi:hypothetical protein